MLYIGSRIKKARKAKKMTQEELAKKVGLKKPTISNYETGKLNPPYGKIVDLASALDTSIEYLTGNEYNIFDEQEGKVVFNMTSAEIELIKELRKHIDIYKNILERPKDLLDHIEKIYR